MTSDALLQALEGSRRGKGGATAVKVVAVDVRHVQRTETGTCSGPWHTIKRRQQVVQDRVLCDALPRFGPQLGWLGRRR